MCRKNVCTTESYKFFPRVFANIYLAINEF